MSWHETDIVFLVKDNEGYVETPTKRRRDRRFYDFPRLGAVTQAKRVMNKCIEVLQRESLTASRTGYAEYPDCILRPRQDEANCRWIRDRQLMFDEADGVQPPVVTAARVEFVPRVSVGAVTYKLRQPSFAVLEYENEEEHQVWTFRIEPFSEQYSGNGWTREEAKKDCFNKIHIAFQGLVALRPFRMNAEQMTEWTFLESVIDVEDYWQQIPLRVWETGTVSSTKSSGFEVNWRDGNLAEVVKFEQATPEFARLTCGDWFDALVERNPSSRELKQVLDIRRIEPLPIMSEAEVSKWLEALPVGQSLPKSTKTLADL